MKQKTYRGASFEELLARATKELGDDALVLSSRRLEEEGLHEIVVASEPQPVAALASLDGDTRARLATGRAVASRTEPAALAATANGSLATVQVAARAYAPAPSAPAADAAPAGGAARAPLVPVRVLPAPPQLLPLERPQVLPLAPPSAATLTGDLVELLELAGVESRLARRLVEEAGGRHAARAASLRTAIARILGAGRDERGEPSIVLLAGPSGVGKTTMAAKLAAHARFRQGRRPALVTLDTFRVGAVEQARTFAELLGVPFRAVEDEQGLQDALRLHRDAEPLIIDTPGLLLQREADRARLRAWLEVLPPDAFHLVLSASSSPAHLVAVLEGVALMKPAALLVTKLDEQEELGVLVNACAKSGRPLRYVSDGPRVPSDLRVPAPAHLARRILPGAGA
jgi:flagellar biosynthesis protein FlhF